MSKICKTCQHVARRLVKVGSIHFFDGPIIPFGGEVKIFPISSTDQVGVCPIRTVTQVRGQEMIMQHLNFTVQGDRTVRQGPRKQCEDPESHLSTMRNTSQRNLQLVPKHPRTDVVVQQVQADGIIRRRQLSRTSRTRQPRSRASART